MVTLPAVACEPVARPALPEWLSQIISSPEFPDSRIPRMRGVFISNTLLFSSLLFSVALRNVTRNVTVTVTFWQKQAFLGRFSQV